MSQIHYDHHLQSNRSQGFGCRYVCLYDVEDRILLRRVQISSNRSLDGVLDQLNSKEMTDAGPAQLLDDAASDEDELLPPTTAGVAPSFSDSDSVASSPPTVCLSPTFSLFLKCLSW